MFNEKFKISSFVSYFLVSCAIPEFAKPSKVNRDDPVNADERARKNIEEGRGISLKGALKAENQLLTNLALPIRFGEHRLK